MTKASPSTNQGPEWIQLTFHAKRKVILSGAMPQLSLGHLGLQFFIGAESYFPGPAFQVGG